MIISRQGTDSLRRQGDNCSYCLSSSVLRLTVTTYVLLCPPFSLSSGVQTLATVSSRYWSAMVLAIFLLGSLMNLHICKDAERKTSSPFLSLLLRRLLRPRFPGVCHRVSHLSVLLCLEARQKDRLVSAFHDNITTARWSLPPPFTPAYHAVLSTGCRPLLATSIFKDRSQRCVLNHGSATPYYHPIFEPSTRSGCSSSPQTTN